MPLQHLLHPSSGLRDGVMHTFAQLRRSASVGNLTGQNIESISNSFYIGRETRLHVSGRIETPTALAFAFKSPSRRHLLPDRLAAFDERVLLEEIAHHWSA
jgi:hypothetical protein